MHQPVDREFWQTYQHHVLVLYDGVCGLCHHWVQYLLKRDKHDALRFLSLQSSRAAELLAPYGLMNTQLDTVYVIEHVGLPKQRLLQKSQAILCAVERLGGIYHLVRFLRVVPVWWLNFFYERVAQRRYRLFGHLTACWLPKPENRHKFIS